MHKPFIILAWGLAICLVLTGCGEGDEDDKNGTGDGQAEGYPTRAEVVVEPSTQKLVIDGDLRESAQLVRELLTDETVQYPVSCEITIDDAYKPVTRVRLAVEITAVEGKIGPDTAKGFATQVYDALAAAFAEKAKTALQDELNAAKQDAESAKTKVADLQKQVSAYQQSRQGLPATDASRKKRRYFDVLMRNTLDQQIAAEEAVRKLGRRVERGDHATLKRIR